MAKPKNPNLLAGALRSKIHGFLRKLGHGVRPNWGSSFGIQATIVDGKLALHAHFYKYPGKDRETARDNADSAHIYEEEVELLKAVQKKFGGSLKPVTKQVHRTFSGPISSVQLTRTLEFRRR